MPSPCMKTGACDEASTKTLSGTHVPATASLHAIPGCARRTFDGCAFVLCLAVVRLFAGAAHRLFRALSSARRGLPLLVGVMTAEAS